MSTIKYLIDTIPTATAIIDLYRNAGLNRPINDVARIEAMYEHSNLVVTAWLDGELVGVSRALTDFNYCCYLSDLAVKLEHQQLGIGKELIRITKETIGKQTMLLLLSAPNAMDYYPKVGFDKVINGFRIPREF